MRARRFDNRSTIFLEQSEQAKAFRQWLRADEVIQ